MMVMHHILQIGNAYKTELQALQAEHKFKYQREKEIERFIRQNRYKQQCKKTFQNNNICQAIRRDNHQVGCL